MLKPPQTSTHRPLRLLPWRTRQHAEPACALMDRDPAVWDGCEQQTAHHFVFLC